MSLKVFSLCSLFFNRAIISLQVCKFFMVNVNEFAFFMVNVELL